MPYIDYDDSEPIVFSDAFMRRLDRFLETRIAPFTIQEALASLNKPCTEEAASDVFQYLSRNPLVFRMHYDFHTELSQWLTRAGLFSKKEFAVKVSKMELASGVFIPASRCSIFANPNVAASDYRFYAGRKQLEKTVVDASLDEVLPFYALAGEEFASQAVAMDSEECTDVWRTAERAESGDSFPLKVVDMREFYWQQQVKPGDYLVFKVANWHNPRFLVRVRRQEEAAEDVAKWRELFWQFLEKSFEDRGPWVSIEAQILEAFFFGYNSDFFSLPPDDIVNAIELSPDIGFLPFGMETRLWKEGKPYPVHENWEIWLEDVLCADDADIFEATKFPALPEVLFAYVQDAVWRDELHPLPLLERICDANGGKTTKAGKSKLMEFIYRGYHELAGTYNIFEDTAANLRARFLDFYSRIVSLVRFCQKAGAQPTKLNEQRVLILTQFAAHTAECLRVICYTVFGVGTENLPPPESADGMADVLATLEDSLKTEAENFRASRARKSRKG